MIRPDLIFERARLTLVCAVALASILLLRASAAPSVQEFDLRVWRMQMHWNKFLRSQWGCASDAANKSECNRPPTSNLAEFRASCEAAKTLWELKGDCQ